VIAALLVHWAAAFAVTQTVEIPVYMRAQRGARASRSSRIAIAFAASALTHPIVWFVIPRIWLGRSYVAMVLASEAFAVAAEAIWLSRFGVHRALAWSLAANGASVMIGFGLRALTGWP
jgi:hypothetical protein